MMKKKCLCALSGALTGVINGLFGAGGGLILVPLLIRAVKLEDSPRASNFRRHYPSHVRGLRRAVPLTGTDRFLGAASLPRGGLVGGVAAGLTFDKFSAVWLRRILGAFIIYAGVKMVFNL